MFESERDFMTNLVVVIEGWGGACLSNLFYLLLKLLFLQSVIRKLLEMFGARQKGINSF